MELNEITYKIRGAIFEVYKYFGTGLLESVYEAALAQELMRLGLKVQSQVNIPVVYKETELNLGFLLDLIVEDTVIIEIKSIEALQNVHKKQLLSYLKLSNKPLGILVNFNVEILRDHESIIRIIH